MANRPCKPDADMKRLWQLLLPGTSFPVCGTDDASRGENARSAPPHDLETATDQGVQLRRKAENK